MSAVQYQATVGFDSTLIDVGYLDTENFVVPGLVIDATKITTGAPAATAGVFAPSAKIGNAVDGTSYQNSGTTAAPVWSLVSVGAAGNVAFKGRATGGTTATRVYAITGVLSTDIASAVINASTNAVTIQKATTGAGTLTVLFSGDPGASTSVDYIIVR